MSQLIVSILAACTLLAGQSALAVDERRIWLPKKYSEVKPKLLAAAREAEQTRRCVKVVAGEMIVRKNTEEHYYFVITCRDENVKTYNLSYLYPVAGQVPVLKAEQLPKNVKKQQQLEISETGIDKVQVVTLCRNELVVATDTLDEVTLLEDLPSDPVAQDSNFHYVMPFTALSELGNEARYRADCRVSQKGKATIDIALESAGARVLCTDSLRAEAMLLGRPHIIDADIVALPAPNSRFRFQIPFDTTNRGSSAIRYQADCQLEADGSSEIVISLQALGALAICKDGLRAEAFLMNNIEIVDQPLSDSVTDDFFQFQLGFSANGQGGDKRQFKAHCLVDKEGEVEVSIEIDKSSILAVCISALKHKTKKMLDVVILELNSSPLQEDDDGYVAIIPFDAKSPNGRSLNYQAECRVDGSGRSNIQLKARK